MFKLFLLRTIEQALNSRLTAQTRVAPHLKLLCNQCVAFDLSDVRTEFFMLFTESRVLLQSQYIGTPDLRIRGASMTFLKTGCQRNAKQLPNDLEIIGNIQIAQRFQEYLQALQFDWEACASDYVGDRATIFIANLIQKFTTCMKRMLHNTQHNVTEFLQQEIRLLPSREALEQFYASVDDLRRRVAHLTQQARFHRAPHATPSEDN